MLKGNYLYVCECVGISGELFFGQPRYSLGGGGCVSMSRIFNIESDAGETPHQNVYEETFAHGEKMVL